MGVQEPVKTLNDLDDADDEECAEEVETCTLSCVEEREEWIRVVTIVVIAHFCPDAVG